MEDGKIVDLYLQRDENAVQETKNKYGQRLFALSRRITGSHEDAAECENDTYLHAWNSIPPKEPRDYFAAFLYRITRNLSIDRYRRNKKDQAQLSYEELSEELSDVSADFSGRLVEEKAFAGVLNSFLSKEEEKSRKIFVKRYFFFESVSEIASELSVSESMVKTSLFRARKRLKDALTEEDGR